MMKLKSLLLTAVLGFVLATTASAQFELKINPIGALFSSPDISAEYGIAPSFGLEGTVSLNFGSFRIGGLKYQNRGFGKRLSGKYYFAPDGSIDRWYAGIYTKFRKGNATYSDDGTSERIKSTRLAVGFLFGHKWVTKHNLVFEINTGFGRAFIRDFEYSDGGAVSLDDFPLANWDFVGTFAIGYRFGQNK